MSYTQCESMRELKSLHQSWHAKRDFELRDWSGSIAISLRDFVNDIKHFNDINDCIIFITCYH